MSFSNTLNYMIKSGEGYRNTCCTSGVSKLSDIINFEVIELDNKDIFDFMQNNYSSYDINSEDIINYTLHFIAKIFDTDINKLNGVWLTTYQDVIDRYLYKDVENTIIKVFIHKNKMIPISDLDKDGTLFVYVGDINMEDIINDKDNDLSDI